MRLGLDRYEEGRIDKIEEKRLMRYNDKKKEVCMSALALLYCLSNDYVVVVQSIIIWQTWRILKNVYDTK